MLNALPLSAQSIDFPRVVNFFNLYQHVVETHADPRKCEVLSAFQRVKDDIGQMRQMMRDEQSNFSVQMGPEEVVRGLVNPVQAYDAFVNTLLHIVETTARAEQLFFDSYVDAQVSTFDDAQKALFRNQRAVAQDNSMRLSNLRDQRGNVIKSNYKPHSKQR